MKNLKVGVLGAGTMGLQIAAFLSAKNIITIVWNYRIKNDFDKKITRLIKLHKRLGDLESNISLNPIIHTDKLEDLKDCDVIIESITENKDEKIKLFKKLDKILINPKVTASNTSTISITELAKNSKYKEKFLGTHFFNPLMSLPLVEIIKTSDTLDDTIKFIIDFLSTLNKHCILIPDTPGFIVNRLLFLMINEAIIMVEENISSIKNIDTCMKLGANHNMGPLELADLIGLDICLNILNTLFKTTGEIKYKPAKMLVKNVKELKLGKKTKIGFYKY